MLNKLRLNHHEVSVGMSQGHLLNDSILQLMDRKLRFGSQKDKLQVIFILSANPGDERATDLLVEALQTDEDELIRARIVADLPQRPSQKAMQALLFALEDKHSGIRRQAVEMVAQLHLPETIHALIKRLSDPDYWVRTAAIEAVSWSEDPRVSIGLLPLLDDPMSTVRRSAIEAYANGIIQPLPVDALREKLADDDPWMRIWALEALKNEAPETIIADVVERLYDPHADVRERAIRVISHIDPAGAVPHFGKLVETYPNDSHLIRLVLEVAEDVDTLAANRLRELCTMLLKSHN